MRRLGLLTALSTGLACPTLAQPTKPSSEGEIDGIRLTLTGEDTLPLGVVLRGGPTFDATRSFFTVTLTNASDRVRTLPVDELGRAIVRVYTNPATGEQVVDNVSAPPRRKAILETLQPGEQRAFQVAYDHPARIAPVKEGRAHLNFCVRWDAAWLRARDDAPDVRAWNASFELCRDVQIVAE